MSRRIGRRDSPRGPVQRLQCDGCPARSRELRTVRLEVSSFESKTLALCPKCIEALKKLPIDGASTVCSQGRGE